MIRRTSTALFLALGIIVYLITASYAQQLSIKSVSVSRLGKTNLCGALGGQGIAPTVTIGHSKSSGTISISMTDRLSDGRTINHGSTSVSASPSGTTKVKYSFLAPCNQRTSQGLKSSYYVMVSTGGSSKTVLWGRYP